MTLVCATNSVDSLRSCTELGAHEPSCPDHGDGGPGVCRGCLPLAANVGFLCSHCFTLLEHAYAGWDRWQTLIRAAGGRAVSPTGAVGGTSLGYSNLSLAFLELDACERHLTTRQDRTLLMWVNDPDGAAHAIQFAHAALNAYRTLEVEERERRTPPPARCPGCGWLTHTRNTERLVGAFTVVECQHCGHELDRVRTGPAPWTGSPACEHENPLEHLHCDDITCSCWCHGYGPKSRQAGISALWDADIALAAPGSAPRGEWIITDPHTITRHPAADERKSA